MGILKWSENFKPNKDVSYRHCYAETPFGRFLLTWKSWKDCPTYGFDETPFKDDVWYDGWDSVEEAQAAAEQRLIKELQDFIGES